MGNLFKKISEETSKVNNPIKKFFLGYYIVLISIPYKIERNISIAVLIISIIFNITLLTFDIKYGIVWFISGLFLFLGIIYFEEDFKKRLPILSFLKNFITCRLIGDEIIISTSIGKILNRVLIHIISLLFYMGGLSYLLLIPYLIGLNITMELNEIKSNKYYRRNKIIDDLL